MSSDNDREEPEGSDDHQDDGAEERAEPAARPRKKKRRKKAAAEAGGQAADDKKADKEARDERRPVAARAVPADRGAGSQTGLVAVLALVAGLAAGWFIRGMQPAGPQAGQDPAVGSAAPVGSAVPGGKACDGWSKAICKQAGDESEACDQAKSAAALLSADACKRAMGDIPATLARVKAGRSVCTQLVDKLCKDLGPTTQTCEMVKGKTPSFPTQRCKEMLDNYEKILGELKKMEAQNAPLSPDMVAKLRAGDGPAFGPKDAKVAVVEYSDFQCPFCSRAADAVHKIKEKYGKLVRFVFRQYPLPMHPEAQLAAEASLAAHAQGKFWPYHDLLFQNQRALDRESLEKYAKQVGLDLKKFKKALDDHTYAEAVKADMKLGDEVGVSGTPTMMVGGQRAQNPTDVGAMSSLIDAELKAAGVEPPKSE